MKKIIFAACTLVFFAACQKAEVRYTQNSPEIDTYKQSIKDYETQNWESLRSHYADTAKIMNNVTEAKAISIDENIEFNKQDVQLFSSFGFIADKSEYEMVKTDDGETWVNFWGTWKGTLAANNQSFEIPSHSTAQFVNGKIVRENGYWNNADIVMALQKIEADKAAADSTATAKK